MVSCARAAVASAIDCIKGADSVTDSIVAEDIGQFPDMNVGEALSHITGVQLTCKSCEGLEVFICNVEPDLNPLKSTTCLS